MLDSLNVSRVPVQNHRTLNWQKIAISNFYGQSSLWLSFWNSSESAIHENDSLSEVSKFNYLKAHLGGSALSTIEGFASTPENYEIAIKLIKERFGRSDVLINTHLNNLLRICPVKNSDDIVSFRKKFYNIQTEIRSLESLNVLKETYQNLLCPLLLKCLPPDLVLEYNKSMKSDKYEIDELVDFLSIQLKAKERSLMYASPFNLFINHFKMPKARSKKFKKRSFHGNRHRNSVPKNNVSTASATKLNTLESSDGLEYDFQELKGNRIIDIQTLLGVFSILSCPKCFATGLKLTEDSKEGLCSNFAIVCKCGFMAGFTSTPKENKKCSLNTLLVFGLRLMGRGFSAGMKLLCTLNLPYVCKKTFRIHELKLLEAVKYSCEENMKAASKEVQNLKKTTTCGVSVDGTWQRRGHMSLNGCVSVISIDTGKILDLEVMTQYCKMCEMNIKCDHECSNYKGSSGNMESVGAFRIFERSVMKRELQYTEYYGDGDSKAFLKVKDIYGEDTVTKLECIGHVQKRVGSRLRKFKKKPKDSVEK
ncbi:hypothetical protein AVEN_114447-1, partial [Araneus ventricosus]